MNLEQTQAVINRGETLRNKLSAQLQKQSKQQLRRVLTPQKGNCTRAYNFSSNDYLGLSQHPKVIAAYQRGLSEWGAGAGASPLVTGYTTAHHELSEALSEWFGVERVLLFNSGFSANQGVLQVLTKAGVTAVIDKLCHASIYDGLGHGFGERIQRFRHNDYEDLQNRIENLPGSNCPLIVSEGVFSMDGDRPDIFALSANKGRGLLMLDDAHGIGLASPQASANELASGITSKGLARGECGKDNRGVFAHPSAHEIDIVTGTFGKAFGIAGAFVATDHQIADSILQNARHLIYSTAFAPAQAIAIHASLDILQENNHLQTELQNRIAYFQSLAAKLKLRLMPSNTPIQPLLVGDNALAMRLAQLLRAEGFQCIAIRPPTVPKGTARIRFTLSLNQSQEALEYLFIALDRILNADQELADACQLR
ncbi:8-amino-7-oxononanoate synthase [Aliidiomarina iranensis]|uniref:8-amino-7-oxononanoate synthase n=1 Tax=Aliidiomarina iranensis TaxID=1434071 RepID=A0A432W057_9GAMM|nr:8-amino-7-oxononanoate synthase [Aliidiomarina iranensis]RUO22358.1 8-amino-7-oxononanoate synthase [Aliidiomarina iranensis]